MPGRRTSGAMRGNVPTDYVTRAKSILASATKGIAFTNKRGQTRIPIVYNGEVIGILREDVPDLRMLEPANYTMTGRGAKVRLTYNGRVVGRMRIRWFFQENLEELRMQRYLEVFAEKRGKVLVYDKELCGLCEACGAVCPKGLLIIRDHQITMVNPDECVMCGFCATACPVGALRMEERS